MVLPFICLATRCPADKDYTPDNVGLNTNEEDCASYTGVRKGKTVVQSDEDWAA